MSIPKCPLNFFVPNYAHNRKNDYLLKMLQTEKNEDFDVGENSIDLNQYVTKYKTEKTVRF